MDLPVTLPQPLEPDIELSRVYGNLTAMVKPANCTGGCSLNQSDLLSPQAEEHTAWMGASDDVLYIAFPLVIIWGVASGLVSLCVLARQVKVSHDSYLLGLVTASVLLLACGGTLRLQEYIPHSNAYQYAYGYVKSLTDWLWYTTLWLLVVMTLERSMTSSQNRTKSLCSPIQAAVVTIMVYCVCFISALPQFWEYEVTETFDYGSNHTLAMAQISPAANTPEFRVMYFWYTVSITVFLPYPLLLTMIVLLSRGMRQSRQSRRHLSTNHSTGNILNRKVSHQLHLSRLFLVMILLYLVLTGPFTFLLIADRVNPHWNWPVDNIYTALYNIFEFTFYFYYAILFFLFCSYSDKFRYSFVRMFCCCCKCEKPNEENNKQQQWQPVKQQYLR